jgi:hypothetical protein
MRRHKDYQEMLPLLLYGELDEANTKELHQHLAVCGECRKDLDDYRKTHAFLAKVPLGDIQLTDLEQARRRLFESLQDRHRAPSVWVRLADLLTPSGWSRPAFALVSMTLFVLGFLVSRFAVPVTTHAPMDVFSSADTDVQIRNVRFVDGTNSGGDVEFAFDAVKPMHVTGSINSPTIQKILAHALLNERNPGVRLRAASSIISTPTAPLQREVKAALMLTLTSDNNAGVRKEALTALLRYPADREVRDALLQVLLHDTNPSLRIAAINGLDSLRVRGDELGDEMLQSIRQSGERDDNLYVRVKAQSIFQEVKQP